MPYPESLCLGTDLVFIPRLKARLEKSGPGLFLKLLTPAEWAYCQSGGPKRVLQRAAARIAAKEAVAKALGCGLNGLGWGKGIDWQEVEVVSGDKAPPQLRLHGKAATMSLESRITSWRLSLSHDGDYAMATVVGL